MQPVTRLLAKDLGLVNDYSGSKEASLSELDTRVNGLGKTGSPVTDSLLGEDGESFSR